MNDWYNEFNKLTGENLQKGDLSPKMQQKVENLHDITKS
jgi:hypothetical protein